MGEREHVKKKSVYEDEAPHGWIEKPAPAPAPDDAPPRWYWPTKLALYGIAGIAGAAFVIKKWSFAIVPLIAVSIALMLVDTLRHRWR